ncbi:SusC/RagA family TonB-linked outer membrane protein [Barnesiella sp. An22]|uniref:SusC/RagA family TonB-linked outer membrane protein n=2 Tax=unclassified Barnesiella TaxID=2645177 RepID=UPI001F1504BB|nr:SusC/RagA family TonB-linked outer membrane protein [Barnesiella sp. An22]
MADSSASGVVQGKIAVSGTVKDKNGEPLIGVSVVEKGTTNGMITDLDGNFGLSVSSPEAVLEFSYVGYNPVSVKVGDRTFFAIEMGESTQNLDEVVVTALGIKREKKMLGYAVQDIKADKLNTTGDPSVIGALSGKVAGLQMNTAGTGLSGSTKITLRGNSSLTDNNQPLWVVDGVPFSDNSSSDASLFGGVDRGGSAVDINPEDIESISVLKGPNAAALYGSRAGNGVILITTKRGVKEKGFGVTYSGNFTWTSVASSLEQQTTYGQGKGGVFDPNVFESFGAPLDGHTYTGWLGQELQYKDYGNKFDQYFNTGFTQTHNVAIGKAEENYNYRTSFGSTESQGLFDGEGLSKINIDLKAGMKMNKYLSMDSKISLSRTKATDRPQYGKGGEVYQLLYIPRNIPLNDLKTFRSDTQRHIYYVNPTLQELNPYYINYQYSNMDERWRAFGYYTIKIDFTPWLYATGKYSFDYYDTSIEEQNRTNGIDDQSKESYKSMEQRYYEHNIEGMILGHNTFAERFRLGYSLGGNIMYQRTSGLTGYSENMAKEGIWYHNSALGKDIEDVSGEIAASGEVATNLTDGNHSTAYLPDFYAAAGQSVRFVYTFDAPKSVSRFQAYFLEPDNIESALPTEVKFEVSENGTDFDVVNTAAAGTDVSYNLPEARDTKAVAFTIGLGLWMTTPIAELEVYGKDGTAIDEITVSRVLVAPNPVNQGQKMAVAADQAESIEIYSMQGALVKAERAKETITFVSTDDLTPGIYFMVVKGADYTETVKVIVK